MGDWNLLRVTDICGIFVFEFSFCVKEIHVKAHTKQKKGNNLPMFINKAMKLLKRI